MINKIIIVSRREVNNWMKNFTFPFFGKVWALISIYGDSPLIHMFNKPMLGKLGCKYVMDEQFHEIDKEIGKYILFNEAQLVRALF